MKKRIGAVVALLAGVSSGMAMGADPDTVAANIYSTAVANPPADSAVAGTLALLQADGSFSDVDYTDTQPSNWQPPKHLNKLNDMAIAYSTPGSSYYQSASLKTSILSAYNYWVAKDYQNSNWFFNQITVPDKLSQAMLIMQQNNMLPTANYTKAIGIVHRAIMGTEVGGATQGANLASQSKCTIVEGAIRYRATGATTTEKSGATSLIQSSYTNLGRTLATATNLADDGIRVDRSFQQHQQTLYDGGYGASLLGNVATTSGWASGTALGLSASNVQKMVDYILDGGPQWMVRGTTFDPLATGRYWSRPGTVDAASNLLSPVTVAKTLSAGGRTTELNSLQTRLADAKANQIASPTLGPSGNKSYWISDYMVHQRPGYMLSVKSVSTRTNTPETINGENLKAGYGTHGVNLVFRTGREYDNIYPAWDWYRLPGTTSERSSTGTGGSYSLLPDHHYGTTTMAGGVSRGGIGGSIYQMSEFGITANKSYFFFDRGEIAMGNSIKQATANTAGGVIGTNVNQTLLKSNVVYSTAAGQSTTIGSGQTVSPGGLRWVNHDSIGYFFLSPVSNATIRTIQQSGNWDSINTAGRLQTIRQNVFSLDLDHGALPSAASYLYAIIPNITPAEMDAYLASNPFTVLRNDSRAQAVTDNVSGITEITFFDRGNVTFPSGITLSQTNRYHGTSVIWDPNGTTIDFSFANVDGYASGNFTFTVNRQLTGTGAAWDSATGLTTLTFSPMTGSMAGSTFTRTFAVIGGQVDLPEPASLAVVALAGVLAGQRRRRQPVGRADA